MFATETSKKFLIALAVSGVLLGPAEAKGWKFHVLHYKVELGNGNPVTIRPPGEEHKTVSFVPCLNLPGDKGFNPGLLDPTILGAKMLLGGISSWISAPRDIRKSVDDAGKAVDANLARLIAVVTEFTTWIKDLVTSYGLWVLLGLFATMVLSTSSAAYILGRQIRKGLYERHVAVLARATTSDQPRQPAST